MTVSLGNSSSSAGWQPQSSVDYTEMYLRQVEQSVRAGNMTLAEQQISALQERLRTAETTSPPVGGPVLRTVNQYVSQVAEQIRAGDAATAEQSLVSTRQYAAKVASASR